MLSPLIKNGTLETTQEQLRFGSNCSFRYHVNNIPASAYKLPISDSRILHSAVDISYALTMSEIHKFLQFMGLPQLLTPRQQENLIILFKKNVIMRLRESEIKNDLDRVKRYITELNLISFSTSKVPVNSDEFVGQLSELLMNWMTSIMVQEGLLSRFRHFELSEDNFKQLEKRYFVNPHRVGCLPGGVCYDFAFTQLCEEEAYGSIFGDDGLHERFTDEMSIQWLSEWGYTQITNQQGFQNYDLIIYCSNLLKGETSVIKHYGLILNGQVVSKLGIYPNTYQHDLECVCLAYGNHYYVFRKSSIPSLDKMLQTKKSILEKSTPLTAEGIKADFKKSFWKEYTEKLENILPCSDIVPAGREFLVRYANHAVTLLSHVSVDNESDQADTVDVARNHCLDKITELCTKLKI